MNQPLGKEKGYIDHSSDAGPTWLIDTMVRVTCLEPLISGHGVEWNKVDCWSRGGLPLTSHAPVA
jgi:hypothetical protein